MRRYLVLGLLVAVLISACTAVPNEQQNSEDKQSPLVTVYRSPT